MDKGEVWCDMNADDVYLCFLDFLFLDDFSHDLELSWGPAESWPFLCSVDGNGISGMLWGHGSWHPGHLTSFLKTATKTHRKTKAWIATVDPLPIAAYLPFASMATHRRCIFTSQLSHDWPFTIQVYTYTIHKTMTCQYYHVAPPIKSPWDLVSWPALPCTHSCCTLLVYTPHLPELLVLCKSYSKAPSLRKSPT